MAGRSRQPGTLVQAEWISMPNACFRLCSWEKPPCLPKLPSRGLRPEAPLRRYPHPSSAACPDRATPLYALLRAAATGRPLSAGAAALDAGAGSPLAKSAAGDKGGPQGLGARGAGAQMPFDFPIRMWMAGSRSFWASSGSRSLINAVESLMSAKQTVTCFRSPSRALREVRIFSARCWGG